MGFHAKLSEVHGGRRRESTDELGGGRLEHLAVVDVDAAALLREGRDTMRLTRRANKALWTTISSTRHITLSLVSKLG